MYSHGRCPRCGHKEEGAVTIVDTIEAPYRREHRPWWLWPLLFWKRRRRIFLEPREHARHKVDRTPFVILPPPPRCSACNAPAHFPAIIAPARPRCDGACTLSIAAVVQWLARWPEEAFAALRDDAQLFVTAEGPEQPPTALALIETRSQ